MKTGIIYRIICLITGLSYIGKSVHKNIFHRIYEHLSGREKGCIALHNAIKKYGRENFAYEILYKDVPLDALSNLEMLCIRDFNTKSPNGYNLTDGGEGFTSETAQELSDKRIEEGTHNFLRSDHAENCRIRAQKKVEEGTHNFLSPEHIEATKKINQERMADGTHSFAEGNNPMKNPKKVLEFRKSVAINKRKRSTEAGQQYFLDENL